jgi:filamentous hemagglutinin family protein
MTRLPHASPGSHRLRLSLLGGLALLQALLAVGQAAVTSAITGDGTLGTTVTPSGQSYVIGGGTLRGSNLFQSFDRFTVGTGDTATFTGPAGTANILSRVTGGQRSEIDGRLQSTIQGANLYLLNPSGVLFGPNARLDVQGSFHVSTADSLRFTDGVKFSAHLGQESLLTVASPMAFGFLANHPAAITMQGSVLQVPVGKALSVVGGDITVTGGSLQAPSGRLQLASVASPGEAVFSPLELAPELQVDTFARLGHLTLEPGALVDVSGTRGGTVLMRADRLRIERAVVSANTEGDQAGARLGIDLRLRDEAVIRDDALVGSSALASGAGGAVEVQGGQLTLTNGAQIRSHTGGSGQAGAVTVQVERLHIDGVGASGTTGIRSVADAGASGDVGTVIVHADRLFIDGGTEPVLTGIGSQANRGAGGNTVVLARDLEVRNGATIFSSVSDSGQAGVVTVQAEHLVLTGTGAVQVPGLPPAPARITSAALPGATGTSGEVRVTADTLEVRVGGVITTTTLGPGNAGTTMVQAQHLRIDGGNASAFTAIASTAGIGPLAGGTFGNAGSIRITASELELHGGGAITSATFGSGNAGTVTVQADRLVITGSSTFVPPSAEAPFSSKIESSAEPGATGAGGAIHITAHMLVLADHGTVATRSSSSQGNAGNITLRVEGAVELRGGAVITTEASQADAGNIVLTAQGPVRLQDSAITASVGGGRTTVGGNLTLRAPWVILEGSRLVANAFEGMGGRIQIDALAVLADPISRIEASSDLGIPGTVDIRAPVTSLSRTLAPLPQAFVSATALLPVRCAARFRGGHTSSLVLGGRDGLPADPGGVLPSPLVIEERLAADPAVTEMRHQPPSSARFALLADQEKALPRLGCPK